MKPIFDSTIQDILTQKLIKLEDHFKADVIFYYGSIFDGLERWMRDLIEELKTDSKNKLLCVVLNTPGGSAETVEILVKIIRHHYEEVYFIVPDAAYSAGTIFCMSGDKIFMDYSSSLGPIDPQVRNNNNTWVPALGYLDKVEELIEKSANGTLTQAELVMLTQQDLAMLRKHEQARELTIALLKEWLVKYKFKNWSTHRTDPAKIGSPVTEDEKKERATQIAKQLGNNKTWHSHGRSIGAATLTKDLRLEIDDYSIDDVLKPLIREYNDLICQYILKNKSEVFFHTRKFI